MNRSPIVNEQGFALVTVIWGLGLIALLGTTLIVNAKYRSRIASDDFSVAKASVAAESAVNVAIAALLLPGEKVNFPLQCRLPGGERVLITVEEETGKVDLNTASKTTIERFFAALSSDKATGSRIAGEILKARTATQSPAAREGFQSIPDKGETPASRRAPFTSIMELEQVAGVTPAVFRKAVPFVTTGSGLSEPAPEAAPSSLIRILGLTPPGQPHRILASGNLTVRADVGLLDGSRQVREALIAFGGEKAQPYAIREWRLGDATEPLRTRGHLPPCITFDRASTL